MKIQRDDIGKCFQNWKPWCRLVSLPKSQTNNIILQTEVLFLVQVSRIHEESFALTNKSSSGLICKTGVVDDTSFIYFQTFANLSFSGPILGSGE